MSQPIRKTDAAIICCVNANIRNERKERIYLLFMAIHVTEYLSVCYITNLSMLNEMMFIIS